MKLYKFNVYCGRSGSLDGIFVAEAEDVENLCGKTIYFGEVLGKHSEVIVTIEMEMFEVLTEDQDFIKKFIELNCSSGFNPFDYEDDE